MEFISWDKLEDYITRRIPAVLPITGGGGMSLVVGRDAVSLALRIPYGSLRDIEPSPYKELYFELRTVDGKEVFELSTNRQELYHSFYIFAMAVAGLIATGKSDPGVAIHNSLGKFDQLLTKRSLLSETEQLGLFGELGLLEALLRIRGMDAFLSWLGPTKERHDFRFNDIELEVKSTINNSRIHTINGLIQLEPSPGKSLYILSIQFEQAGQNAGQTLPQRIDSVRKLLKASGKYMEMYSSFLGRLQYKEEDAVFYPRVLQLKSQPILIPVDPDCPRLTNAEVKMILMPSIVGRILDVDYQINVDGLGYPEDSFEYQKILQGIILS